MPSVPQYNQQVNQAAVGGIKVNTAQPIEAFGGGEAGAAPTKALQQSLDIAQNELRKADQVAITGADAEAARIKHVYYNELSNLKGEKAFGAKEELNKKYKADIEKITGSLSTPGQRSAFGARAKAHEADLNLQIDKHTFAEAQQVDKQKTMASIDIYGNEAVMKLDDSFGHEVALNEQKKTMAAYAERNGLPKEVAEVEMRKLETNTRSQTIDRFLFNEAPEKAKAYFELHKDKFGLEEQKKIKAAIENASVDKDAQGTVNQLLAAGVSQKQGLEEIRKIEDVKLHDETRKRFLNEWAVKEAVKKDTLNDIQNSFANQIDQNPASFDTLKKTGGWKALELEQKKALENYAQAKKERKNIVTDFATYQKLTMLASSPETREMFLKENIANYIDKLSPSDAQEIQKLQNNMRKGDNTESTFLRSRNDIVKQSLGLAGIKVKEDSEDFYKINRAIDEQIQARRAAGEKVGPKEVQEITDGFIKDVSIKKSFLGYEYTSKEKLYKVSPEKAMDIQMTEYKDIPKAQKDRIKNYLQQKKMQPTEAAITKLYFEMVKSQVKANPNE